MTKFPPEIKEFIKNNISGRSTYILTEIINKKYGTSYTVKQIRTYKNNRHLVNGIDCKFQKGHVPANKGTNIGGWEPTQFKKGCIAKNKKPIGSESIRTCDKRNHKYVYVKIAEPNKWREKHLLVWEKQNGKIPPGHCIIFLDGNTLNVVPENLIIVSKAVNLMLNRLNLRFDNPEYTKTAILIAKLKLKSAEVNKKR